MFIPVKTGEKYGKLTIIEDLGMILQNSNKKRHFVKCKCDCGNIKDINWYDIKQGKINSCGCIAKELISNLGKTRKHKSNLKHGFCHSKIYQIYHNMKGKCYNKNNKKYDNFGKRGITVYNEWLGKNGFINFYNWSITKGNFDEKNRNSLCRKDMDKDFTPENCFFSSVEYAKKNCLSLQSKLKQKEKADKWRKDNKNMFIKAIHKGLKTKLEKYGKLVNNRDGCTWKQGWRDIGGNHKYFRSKWEANYARYLEFLKQHHQIKDWKHEPKTFWFGNIKRGCCSYLPDFEIINNDNSIEYHEVKGWYDSRSKTKIKRMAKYYPEIKLVVIFGKEYKLIENQVKYLIKDWE